MFQTRALGILSLIVAFASPAWAQSDRLPAGQKWVATWAASVHGPYPSGNPSAQPDMKFALPDPAQGAVDQSFRLIVKPDLWGDRVRIRLANTFGTQPVTFSAIHVGVSASAGSVVKGTNRAVSFGEARVYDAEAADLAIVTYGNGVWLALRAARTLAEQDGLRARVVDLRWLNPLDGDVVARHARECGRLLVVDEGRRTGGISEAVITAAVERLDPPVPMRRVVGRDTYIPLGPAASLVLPSETEIRRAALALCRRAVGRTP